MVALHLATEADVDEALPSKLDVVRHLVPRGFRAVTRRGAFVRRAVVRTPLLSRLSDRRYEAKMARYARHLPWLPADQRTVLADLNNEGVSIRPADLPADVVDSAYGFVDLLAKKNVDGPCVKATPRELGLDPTLFAWGLSDQMLDLAECHIGLPPRYLGVEVKRELVEAATGRSHEVVRRWHLDHEDRRMLKVIVYLSDVHEGAGPFGYVHKAHSDAVLASTSGRTLRGVTDEKMQTVVSPSEWKKVTGARMTAIHVDTGQVFHRVFPPTTSERYSVTFAYSSRSPFYVYSRLMLPRKVIQQLRGQLTRRQWDALCVGRSSQGR